MKFFSCAVLGFAALCLTACTTLRQESIADVGYDAAVSADHADRRILVTFNDRSIGRTALGEPALTYRRRGSGYATSAFSERVTAQIGTEYGLIRVSDWPVTALGMHCVVFEIGVGRNVAEVLAALTKDERVALVQTMRRFRVLNDPYSRLQPALDSMQVREAHRWSTGQGVTVAIIDTGIDAEHPDLKGQIISNQDAVGMPTSFGGDIHGTAVAGVIAALANNNEGIVGIAPNAKLLAYKACWQENPLRPESTCDSFTLAKALNNAISRKPQVINLSLTGPADPLLALLVKKALEDHIVVVAAAADAHGDADGFPASQQGVIAVHSSIEQGKSWETQNWLYAPGTKVLTTFPQKAYNFISGNSFAAAHVSGVVALLLALKPDLTLAEISDILKSSTRANISATVAGEAVHSAQINASSAVLCVKASAACTALDDTKHSL